MTCDLLIRAARVVCPTTELDDPGAVAIRDGRIVASGPDVAAEASEDWDYPDGILLPGLIDLHAHPAKTGSVFGVDPDEFALPRGTTTVLSQGDAGAANGEAFVEETIAGSQTRVLLAMNLSRIGESTDAGCFEHLEDADVGACVAAVERHREHVWGIAVNASHPACGSTDPREVVRRGLAVAEETGLPILYGMRRPDWSFDEQIRLLRPGDVVTYCYRREPHGIVENGRVHSAIVAARQRGVLFDVGHGMASFDFEVVEAAIADGFPPDTISTDLQRRHVGLFPQHDLPLTMSKLRAAGMTEADVFAAVTSTPAKVLRLEHGIGSLSPGSCADLSILRWHEAAEPLLDTTGNSRQAGRWEPLLTVRAGRPLESSL